MLPVKVLGEVRSLYKVIGAEKAAQHGVVHPSVHVYYAEQRLVLPALGGTGNASRNPGVGGEFHRRT